jgi:uncharacterized protein YdeI (YjbR/CyaY-like superfamily)
MSMSPQLPDNIRFFTTAGRFRKWLEANHDKAGEIWLGFYKKAAGKKGITYKEALDEALCFGWIDGVRKSVDGDSYVQRFSPRKARSTWSHINVNRVKELIQEKRMAPPGLAAFEARDDRRTGRYSYEQAGAPFDAELEKRFRANRKAWDFFQSQPPYYQRTMKWWIMSARLEETRSKRLVSLIEHCIKGVRVGVMTGGSSKRTDA